MTVVVPYAPGGNTDMMARLGAQRLASKFGQSFVVENRPSAGGALATGAVATAAPDGYTLLFSASSVAVLTPQLQKLNFDPLKQLVPVTNIGIIKRNIEFRIVGKYGMFDHARIPDVCDPELADPGERCVADITELTNAIFFDRSKRFVGCFFVPEQSRHHLVDDHFS